MNVFQYAAANEQMIERIFAQTGYKRITTFFSDLSIAEFLEGAKGIKDTDKNVCKEWLNDVKYFTEYVMCLNHKSWQHAAYASDMSRGDDRTREHERVLSSLYSDLYYKARDLALDTYKDDDFEYFFNTTD